MTDAGATWDVIVVGAEAPGDAARLALAMALERHLTLHGGEIQRGLLRGELVTHRALARSAADHARDELAQLGASVEVRAAKPRRSSGELPALAADPARGGDGLPEPPPFAALEADPEQDRPLRLADLDGPPLPSVEPDRSRPQGRHGGAERPFDPVRRPTPAGARSPTPADARRPTPSGGDSRRAGASQAMRRPTPMLGTSEARRSVEDARASGRRPTPASASVAGEVDTSRPADPFAPRIDPVAAAAAASRSTVEVQGVPSVEQVQARPTAEVSQRGAATAARQPTPPQASAGGPPAVEPSLEPLASAPASEPAAKQRAAAKPKGKPSKPAAAPAPAPATGPLPARFTSPTTQEEPRLELDLDAVRATRPAAPEPQPPMAMPSSSSSSSAFGWSGPTGPNRLLGSDPVVTWLFALAIGFAVGLVVAFGVARARARETVDALEIELADSHAKPTEVELGQLRPPDVVESDRKEALTGVGMRFWSVWLGVSTPVAAALAMIKRP